MALFSFQFWKITLFQKNQSDYIFYQTFVNMPMSPLIYCVRVNLELLIFELLLWIGLAFFLFLMFNFKELGFKSLWLWSIIVYTVVYPLQLQLKYYIFSLFTFVSTMNDAVCGLEAFIQTGFHTVIVLSVALRAEPELSWMLGECSTQSYAN